MTPEELQYEYSDDKRAEIESAEDALDNLKALQSFSTTSVGKALIAERESEVNKHLKKLFTLIQNPNLEQMLSSVIQLKVAIKDLVDFKGSQSKIQDAQMVLDALVPPKQE